MSRVCTWLAKFLTRNLDRSATFTALNQTQGYFNVLEEVGKYNVQLNYFERLWAVRFAPSASFSVFFPLRESENKD